MFYRLLSYCKIYNIEMNRPVGVDSQRAYLIDEIKAINRYNAKRSDFVHYYRSGLTHLDSIYEDVLTQLFIWNCSITNVNRCFLLIAISSLLG